MKVRNSLFSLKTTICLLSTLLAHGSEAPLLGALLGLWWGQQGTQRPEREAPPSAPGPSLGCLDAVGLGCQDAVQAVVPAVDTDAAPSSAQKQPSCANRGHMGG